MRRLVVIEAPRDEPRWSRTGNYPGFVTISGGKAGVGSCWDPLLGLGALGHVGALVLGRAEHPDLFLVHVVTTPHPGRQGGDQEHEGGDGEGDAQAMDERPRDQVREELLA